MPFRSRLAALLLLATFTVAGAEEKLIKGEYTLTTLSTSLPTETATELTVRIDNYSAPGQLKIDQAAGNVRTLTLRRAFSDSDGVIPVENTLIDVKGFTGKLVLKGLAFRLKPKATLISGFDPIKLNHDLLLDSCIVYAETLDGTMLAWQGDPESNIEIKNSWFVAKSSTTNSANLLLAGGNVTLTNNLFNFMGTITASPISKGFVARSNTFNRVQLVLFGTNYAGFYPTYQFTQNLAAYHGALNAVGGSSYYVLSASNFNDASSSILNNRIYQDQWAGIDYPAGTRSKEEVRTPSSYDGKLATETWNWYTEKSDSTTGMLAGNTLSKRYNVLPNETRYSIGIDSDTLRVIFKSADFPRMFQMVQTEYADSLEPFFRMRAPFAGKLSFGPFRIDSMIVEPKVTTYGKPILLAQTETGAFQRQVPSPNTERLVPNYINVSPTSRVFVLVDSGNTPRGTEVEPVHRGETYEHLRFEKVAASGQTTPKGGLNPPAQIANLRFLSRTFFFRITASVQGTMTFATAKPDTAIWSRPDENALFWLWTDSIKGVKDTLIQATYGSVWGDTLLQGTVLKSDSISDFRVDLVEKLSMPAGRPFRMTLPGAELHSFSATGYQIYPENTPADSLRYGSPTLGYRFTWTGRVPSNDSLILLLPKDHPEAQVFVKVPSKAEAEPLSPAPGVENNKFRIRIGALDSGKIFFAGVKYNIVANDPSFVGIINGVSVSNLVSSTSGRLSFRDLPAAEAQNLDGNLKDSVFRNTRYIAGKAIDALGLVSIGPFELAFALPAGAVADSGFEAWYLSGGKWERFPGPPRPAGDSLSVTLTSLNVTHIVAVKRFQAPETYAPPIPLFKGDTLRVNLGGSNLAASPIQDYCLETRTINQYGVIRETPCIPKAPDDTIKIVLQKDTVASAYRVVYFLGKGVEKDTVRRDFVYPEGFGWDAQKILAAYPSLRKSQQGIWHLVSAPVRKTKLKNMLTRLKRDSLPSDSGKKILKVTAVLGISNPATGTRFDTLAHFDDEVKNNNGLDTIILERGKALLIASSAPDSMHLEKAEGGSVTSPKPESLAVQAGWNFIGNPYPIPLRKECLKSRKDHPVRLKALNLIPGTDTYRWDWVTDSLAPFTGYAYNSPEDDILIYDPAAPIAPPAAKRAVEPSVWIAVALRSPAGRSEMALVRGPREYPVGFLPSPAAKLELRVGGKGGYWIKPVADPRRIDEPVEIRSAGEGSAAFTLGQGAGPEFVLIEDATGRVFDRDAARALPLRAGSSTYRLIAGDPGFIAEKARSFAASLPAEILLSQNYPNPARGLTRINLEWPATRDGNRKAYLEVIDTRGRRVAFRPLDGVKAGRQVIELEVSAWKPGVYVYRLAVQAEGKVARFQRKLLVAP